MGRQNPPHDWAKCVEAAFYLMTGGSQKEIAERVDISPNTLRNWMRSDWWPQAEAEGLRHWVDSTHRGARATVLKAVQAGDVALSWKVLSRIDDKFAEVPRNMDPSTLDGPDRLKRIASALDPGKAAQLEQRLLAVEKAELQVEELRKNLVSRELVDAAVFTICRIVRDRLQALPSRAGATVVRMESAAEASQYLESLTNEVLRDMSSTAAQQLSAMFDNREDVPLLDHDERTEILARPISDFGLKSRTVNALQRGGIDTVFEVTRRTEAELMTLRSFGETALEDVQSKLAIYGLSLAVDAEFVDDD
jgi:transposase-like protein